MVNKKQLISFIKKELSKFDALSIDDMLGLKRDLTDSALQYFE